MPSSPQFEFDCHVAVLFSGQDAASSRKARGPYDKSCDPSTSAKMIWRNHDLPTLKISPGPAPAAPRRKWRPSAQLKSVTIGGVWAGSFHRSEERSLCRARASVFLLVYSRFEHFKLAPQGRSPSAFVWAFLYQRFVGLCFPSTSQNAVCPSSSERRDPSPAQPRHELRRRSV